jgi:FtsH-binding integral membrane protein
MTSHAIGLPLTRAEEGTLVGRTMGLVAGTTALFAVGAYLGRDVSYEWGWLFFVGSLLALVGLNAAVQRSEQAAIVLLVGFGALTGLGVAPTVAYYASADPRALWEAGAATTLFIGGFGLAGYVTRRDLSGLGRVLLWALIGLIGFGVLAIFVRIPGATLVYTIGGLVVFAGFTAFDFQRLRRTQDIREAPLLAASIFLDVLNVFLLLLSLLTGGDK